MEPPAPPAASYCGPAPGPEELWASWNLDPLLLIVMALGVGIFALWAPSDPARRASFAGGVATLAVAFISPLCALTVALFSARTGHHLLLVSVAAPLLAYALQLRVPTAAVYGTAAVIVSTAVLWLWHVPAAYALALGNPVIYWLMQGTLLGTSIGFWAVVLHAPVRTAVGMLFASAVQMGLLGALLTFASRPLYEPHLGTTLAFDFTPLTDQQLAGLLMWVPGAIPYLAVAISIVSRRLATAADVR